MVERIGVYPGTFDPITNGHVDIIERASKVVDKLIVGVAENAGKEPLFSCDERVELAQKVIASLDTLGDTVVEVRPFNTLLVDLARECGASLIVRGLRAVSDFEYEFQMGNMNARLAPDIETVFLMASERNQFISSRFVKEIGRLGGDISTMVGSVVAQRLKALDS